MAPADVLEIWEEVTGRPLTHAQREQFLAHPAVQQLRRHHPAVLREAGRLAAAGDVLRLRSWLARAGSVSTAPPPDVWLEMTEGTTPPSSPSEPGRHPRKPANPNSEHSGAMYGGLVNPPPVEGKLHKTARKANPPQRYDG